MDKSAAHGARKRKRLQSRGLETAAIAELLRPFLAAESLPEPMLARVSAYLELLLRWNARINLTAVRDARQMVTRHFGESFFLAAKAADLHAASAIDVGSGAGFPGLPLALYAPQMTVTLIESLHKKATFLREAVRATTAGNVVVFNGRAEDFDSGAGADLVTLRAVERFEQSAAAAAKLTKPGGRLALLIGSAQTASAQKALSNFAWERPIKVPESQSRVLLLGRKEEVRNQEE